MALQGTLDTFALPDVLRLLASTKKTGRLVIAGSRGNGNVWVDDGDVVGADASRASHDADAVTVLFELLRFGGDGSFTFEAGSTPSDPSKARLVEPLLVDAERQLVEWRDIEAVVPSMEAWVSLVPEIAATEIALSAERWKRIVAIGGGTTVAGVARALELGELDVCRGVKELVELGLVEVGSAPPSAARSREPGTGTGASWDPFAIEIPGVAPLAAAEEGAAPVGTVTDPEPVDGMDPVVEDEVSEREPVVSVVEDPAVEDDEAIDEMDDDGDAMGEADEVARQLASLSPKAARAVAAAAKATDGPTREAALAEATDDEDEPINRGLLLKFLSSVKS